ncbi:GNAT family N-acetyltransferase [Flavobacterium ardleyense]|uniref:GNAT family N-acetyltransferase n=1 Tax=Flavobacterium ardleyense TaxID=2038737 RepID=UPI00298C2EAB|nr:GNAT family N-acetyltransferase [Flavobacterium ardleyense]
MIIRKARAEDMEAALELIKELAIYEKEPDAVIVTVEDLIRDGYGEDPLFYCYVAVEDGTIVGMALYYYRYSTWKGRTLHLEDLVVKENQRGSGVGFALYSEIIKTGYEDNVQRIEWNVLNWNTPAIEFYRKSGATVLQDWMVAQMSREQIEKFVTKE